MNSALRVFVSSTSQDLRLYRRAAQELILEQGWLPVLMEHFGTATGTTVEECRQKVRGCDLVVLVLAFRRGWVPSSREGGDGESSITALELEAARQAKIPVRVLMARENWPGALWEDSQSARDGVRKFRGSLNQIAVFFEAEGGQHEAEPAPGDLFRARARQLLLDHREWCQKQQQAGPGPLPSPSAALLPQLPLLLSILSSVEISPNVLLALYRAWAPPGNQALRIVEEGGGAMAVQAAEALAQLPYYPGGEPPRLLAFLRLLAEHLEPPAQARLNAWLASAFALIDQERGPPPPVRMCCYVLGDRASERVELPFTVGVLADLSGTSPRPLLGERRFVRVSRENFARVLRAVRPRLSFDVPDLLDGGPDRLAVELEFERLEDFGADQVVGRLPWLREACERRREAALALLGPRRGGGQPGALAAFDERLAAQLRAVLHHPAFERLEAAWLGLAHLVQSLPAGSGIKVRALGLTKRELARDMERAIEFDQTHLFRMVYADEVGTPGGEPFGLLLCDFDFGPDGDDLRTLEKLSSIAAASHAVLLAAPSPSLLGALEAGPGPDRWQSLRSWVDSRFLALALPGVRRRQAYGEQGRRVEAFAFEEFPGGQAAGPWMNAGWAYAAGVVRSYGKHGWFDRLEAPGEDAVVGLPEGPGPCLQAAFSPERGHELSQMGLLPLVTDGEGRPLMMGHRSVYRLRPGPPEELAAGVVASKITNLLCLARLAHYLGRIERDKCRILTCPRQIEEALDSWLQVYTAPPGQGVTRERRPLRECTVKAAERWRRAVGVELRLGLSFEPFCPLVTIWVSLRN